MRYGSLFSGYGGLDLAVEQALGVTCAWHCETDPACARVLATHWPDTPNLGDITTVDRWPVPPVDVLCGGSPCQDMSMAGARAGIEGDRSGLWAHMATATAATKSTATASTGWLPSTACLARRSLSPASTTAPSPPSNDGPTESATSSTCSENSTTRPAATA